MKIENAEDFSEITFGVITKVPSEDDLEAGNLALAMPLYFRMRDQKILNSVEAIGDAAMSAMAPVFTLGEILILGNRGREVNGRGRKPGKWFVTCEDFKTIEEAIKRAKEVSDPDL